MSLCTVALIHDVTSKINENIKVFSKTSILCFQPRSISKAPELLQAPHRCRFMLRSLGFALESHVSDTKTRSSPRLGNDYLLCGCCSIVQHTLGILFHLWSVAVTPLSLQARLSQRVIGHVNSKPQIPRLMSPSRGRTATDAHSASGP